MPGKPEPDKYSPTKMPLAAALERIKSLEDAQEIRFKALREALAQRDAAVAALREIQQIEGSQGRPYYRVLEITRDALHAQEGTSKLDGERWEQCP